MLNGEPLINNKRLGFKASIICFNDSPSERPSKSMCTILAATKMVCSFSIHLVGKSKISNSSSSCVFLF